MEEIAQVYARSLFEVAQEHDKLDVVRDQIGEFADALDRSRELQTFFFSPYFSTEEIGRQTGRQVELTTNVDPDVLGGIVLRVGNSILDASIRTRLDRLRKQVARA